MKYQFKKYEWMIYFLMGISTLIMVLMPAALVLDETIEHYLNFNGGPIEVELMKKIIIIAIGIILVTTWLLIEGIMLQLLKIVRRLSQNGVFVEENKQSVKKMSKYLIAFAVMQVLIGGEMNIGATGTTHVLREIGDGVGTLFLTPTKIEITIYTLILVIIYILIRVVCLVFTEALEIKKINDEII